jgi:hypothetical protein
MSSHILLPLLCYNSLDIIPYTIDFYKKQDIDIFVLDNFSNDGSWEYLKDNRIPCKRVDTGGLFDLNKLNNAREIIIRKIKPRWVLRLDSDCFILSNTIKKFVTSLNNNFNICYSKCFRFYNTGEEINQRDPRQVFFYFDYLKHIPYLHTYKDFIKYSGDKVIMETEKKLMFGAPVLDYGNTRPKEKREEEFKRRKLAWRKGLSKHWGKHYVEFSKMGWVWDKKNLTDVRKSNYFLKFKKVFSLKGV